MPKKNKSHILYEGCVWEISSSDRAQISRLLKHEYGIIEMEEFFKEMDKKFIFGLDADDIDSEVSFLKGKQLNKHERS